MATSPTLALLVLALCLIMVSGKNKLTQQGHCQTEICSADAAKILREDPFDCVGTPQSLARAMRQCIYGCKQSVATPLRIYTQELASKMSQYQCTDGQAVSCGVTDVLDCTLSSVEIISIAYNVQIDDLTEFCDDIEALFDIVTVCSKCIMVLIPGFETFSDDAQYVVELIETMGNGACNCTRDIVSNLNLISTTTECSLINAYVDLVNVIAVDCIGKLINAPLTLDWLTLVNDYIDDYLPYIGDICNWVVGAGQKTGFSGTLLFVVLIMAYVTPKFFCKGEQ